MYDASKTRKNIDYTLDSGRFVSEIFGVSFCFSSQAHKDKFEREYQKRKEWLDDSLSRRLKVHIDTGYLSAFQLYQQIEGRGFRVIDILGKSYNSPDDIQFCTRWYYG